MCPNIVLTPSCPDQLKKWLIVFATEMINANGENYPTPRSINSMFKYIYSLLSFLINSSVSNKSMCNTNLYETSKGYIDDHRGLYHIYKPSKPMSVVGILYIYIII